MELDSFHRGSSPRKTPFFLGRGLVTQEHACCLLRDSPTVSLVRMGLKGSPCVSCEDKEDARKACPCKVCVALNYDDAHQPSPQETQAWACPVPTWAKASSSASLAGGLERQTHRKRLQSSREHSPSILQVERGSIALDQCP